MPSRWPHRSDIPSPAGDFLSAREPAHPSPRCSVPLPRTQGGPAPYNPRNLRCATMRLSRPTPGPPKCHPWVTLWGATGSNTRVTLCDRDLASGGLRSIEPSGLLKRDIARCHSGGYQGSHPPKPPSKTPLRPFQLDCGPVLSQNCHLDQMPDHTAPRLTHTAPKPCVRVSIPSLGQHGALSVHFRSTAENRTLTELLPPRRLLHLWRRQKTRTNYRLPDFTLLLPYFRITIRRPRNRIRHPRPPAHTIPQQRSNRSKGGKTIENAILFYGVFGVTAVAALLRNLVNPMPVFAWLVATIPAQPQEQALRAKS